MFIFGLIILVAVLALIGHRAKKELQRLHREGSATLDGKSCESVVNPSSHSAHDTTLASNAVCAPPEMIDVPPVLRLEFEPGLVVSPTPVAAATTELADTSMVTDDI